MSAPNLTLRNLLALEIEGQKLAGTFTYNTFDVEQVWIPSETLEDLHTDHPNGKLYILVAPWDEGPNQSRASSLGLREIPVSFGLQRPRVLATDTAAIDLMVDLVDELYAVLRTFDHENYNWLRTEALKDDNGVPFNYALNVTANIFEAYFTAYYNHVIN